MSKDPFGARSAFTSGIAVLGLVSMGFAAPCRIGTVSPSADAGSGPDAGPVIEPGDPGTADVTFDIRSDQDVHPISPLVYGMNGCDGIATDRQTLCRSGGNRLTAYNWENNASNAGSDYYYENDGFLSSSDVPGEAIRPMVQTAKDNGAAALVTVPIVDYVAADKNGGDAGGDVRNSGPDYLSTRFKQNLPMKGAPLSATPDTTDDYVYQDEFVYWMKQAVPGARVLFSLDNEPDLWSSTHPEVHPNPVTYAELVTRDTEYAQAVKSVWPQAEVTGFVSYGWNGYTTLQNAPDAAGRDFIDFYLDQMKQNAGGQRLIDYLDLHWYSEAQGGGLRINDTNASQSQLEAPDVVAAREQAPRSLWDPTYSETSWIVADVLHEPIRLIPRLQEKIAAHYPGTKLAFTEWNYGGGFHISGAIATADALGIFGREGVDLAAYWPLYSDESFAMAALRAYRNYDGSSAAFGDTSISAVTSDVASTSVYASMDAANPSRVVLVALNKTDAPLTAGIRIAHPTLFSHAAVYTITAQGGAALVRGSDLSTVATNAFSYVMPAQSVSVIVPQP